MTTLQRLHRSIPVTALIANARQLVEPDNSQALLAKEYDLLRRRNMKGKNPSVNLIVEFFDDDLVNPELTDETSATICSTYCDARTGERLITMQHSSSGVRYVK